MFIVFVNICRLAYWNVYMLELTNIFNLGTGKLTYYR